MKSDIQIVIAAVFWISALFSSHANAEDCRASNQQVGDKIEEQLKNNTRDSGTLAAAYGDSLEVWSKYQSRQIHERSKKVEAEFLDLDIPDKMDPKKWGPTAMGKAAYDDLHMLAEVLKLKSQKVPLPDSFAEKYKIAWNFPFLKKAYDEDDGSGRILIKHMANQFREYQRQLVIANLQLEGEDQRIQKVYLDPKTTYKEFGKNLKGEGRKTVEELRSLVQESAVSAEKLKVAYNKIIEHLDALAAVSRLCRPDSELLAKISEFEALGKKMGDNPSARPTAAR